MPNQFLPPPFKVRQSTTGELISTDVNDKARKFLPLFQRLAVDIKPDSKGYKQMPHDAYCSFLNSQLFDCTRNLCGLYFALMKALKLRTKKCHSKYDASMVCRRVRPLQISRFRENEASCIIRDERGFENAEWTDIEGIEDYDSLVPDNNEINETSMSLINCDDKNLEKWVGSPWKEVLPKDSSFLIKDLFKK